MTQKRIGALTIGQTPRPDLIAPLEKLLPDHQILQGGALNGVSVDELPKPDHSSYLLETRMRSGQPVLVAESFLLPRLQEALHMLETKGVSATLLLCAGTFADLSGQSPLFVPFRIGHRILKTLRMKSIGVITPVRLQQKPIRDRWEKMGWQATVWTADLGAQNGAFHQQLLERIHKNKLDCLVLDYVGLPLEQVIQLQEAVDIPVIDLGQLAIAALACTV